MTITDDKMLPQKAERQAHTQAFQEKVIHLSSSPLRQQLGTFPSTPRLHTAVVNQLKENSASSLGTAAPGRNSGRSRVLQRPRTTGDKCEITVMKHLQKKVLEMLKYFAFVLQGK